MFFYSFRGWGIPDYMREGIAAYITRGRPMGGFLTAVFENDLMEACGRADDNNLRNLPAYSAYLYNEAPRGCYGSKAAVANWIRCGGLEGIRAQTNVATSDQEGKEPT